MSCLCVIIYENTELVDLQQVVVVNYENIKVLNKLTWHSLLLIVNVRLCIRVNVFKAEASAWLV